MPTAKTFFNFTKIFKIAKKIKVSKKLKNIKFKKLHLSWKRLEIEPNGRNLGIKLGSMITAQHFLF